ncbi:MAG TPA: hypothetical protein VFU43_07370 [Streptosporangiaceae bacterium]|nr:hypothetical protein [Streptosporangiaceae bacterium]
MADNRGTFYIRNSCPYVPDYATTGGGGFTMDSVKAMLSAMDPGHVAAVGQAYLAAADALTTAADRLHEHARRVTEAWSGENAQTALKQLGQLNTTAAELQEKSATTGRTYNWLGSEILPWYRDQGRSMGHGAISDGGDDTAALELLDRMDHRLVEGYNAVPESITKDLPPDPGASRGDLGIRDPGGTQDPWSGPPGGVPSVPSPGSPSDLAAWNGADSGTPTGAPPHGPGSGFPGPAGGGAGLPGAGGTDLAGAGGGVGPDPFGAGGLGGGAGAAGGGLGAGAGGPGAGVLGVGAPGSLGAGSGGRSRSAGENARGAGGRAGAGGPMGAGGGQGGEGEEERERTTWLTEDDDVWSADGDIAPPVIE